MSGSNRGGNGPTNALVTSVFGDDDLDSPRAIKAYLTRVQRLSRRAAGELEDDTEQLFAIIANSKGIPILFGADTRRKAHHIAEPLRECVNAFAASARLAGLTWSRFHKEFGEIFEAGKGKGKGGRQMNWNDV